MNSKFVTLLAAVCLVLVLIILGEWLYADHAEREALNSATAPEKKVAKDEMPVIETNRQPEASYTDLVARPLFLKGRRPVDEPSPDEEQAAVAPVVFDWELNGVYTTQKGLSALFSRSKAKVAKDNYRRLKVGADLDGWKLTEVRTDRALLTQGAQQKELLLRKPKVKDLPKQPNVPNVPNIPPPAEGETENTNEKF